MKRSIMVNLVFLALAACGGGGSENTPPPDGGGNPPLPAATAPAITTQPAAQSVTAPAAASFSVTASGTAPLSYQWRSSTNGTDWTAISGATDASHAIAVTDAGMNGRYYSVVVSNSAGSVTSAAAQLAVASAPSGGGTPTTGPGPLAGPADPFPYTPAPMSATPVTGSAGNRALISWDPTSAGVAAVTVNHTNGAQTQLRVPVNAFIDEVFLDLTEVIDLAPVNSAPAPFNAVLAAVRVGPGDLATERKALTVAFTLPDAVMNGVALGELVAFVADSDGGNLHLVPIAGGQINRPSIQVDHLGVFGIAVASVAQQAALEAAWPTDPGDQIVAALAPKGTAAWRASVQPAGGTANRARALGVHTAQAGDPVSPFLAPLQGFFNNAVVPAFAAAYGDPAQIPAAIQTGFQFLRNAELTGLSGQGGPLQAAADDLGARIGTLIDTYADYVASQCSSVGGPPQLQAMLGWMRTLQLLGHGAKSDEIDDVLPQCSQFRITFHHDFTEEWHTIPGQIDTDFKLHAVVDGTTTVGLNAPITSSPMRLTSLTLETISSGGTGRSTATPEADTSIWSAHGLSVPLLRTRQGTPPTSVSFTLNAYGGSIGGSNQNAWVPLQMTRTWTNSENGSTHVETDVSVHIRLEVPALPETSPFVYGPMLIPASGSATSSATVNAPAYNETSHTRTHSVTVTLSPDR